MPLSKSGNTVIIKEKRPGGDAMSNLIIYFSRSGENYVSGEIKKLERGNTEICAELLQNAVGGDVFEIVPAKPYPEDYRECIERAKKELSENARPKLRDTLTTADIAQYDNIFICSPCWWGTLPCPVLTQLEALDFTGKKVMELMTHEGSELGHSEEDLKKACRGASFGKALAVHGGDAEAAEKAIAYWAASQL